MNPFFIQMIVESERHKDMRRVALEGQLARLVMSEAVRKERPALSGRALLLRLARKLRIRRIPTAQSSPC